MAQYVTIIGKPIPEVKMIFSVALHISTSLLMLLALRSQGKMSGSPWTMAKSIKSKR